MKTYCLELTSRKQGYNEKLNTLREYLQAYILRIMHDEGFFRFAVFVGGTALRLLYDLPRFSEDLDFSLVKQRSVPFLEIATVVKRELNLAGYSMTVRTKASPALCYAFFNFEGLLFEAGLSAHRAQNLSVKVEIDERPPEGAHVETAVVNKHIPLSVLTYDRPSLFAGKLHALLSRRYTKGRDFVDLGWYLSKWKDISPNMKLLTNALKQTGWEGELPNPGSWRQIISKKVEQTEWKKVEIDVENFLE